MKRSILVIALLSMAAQTALAHDFWIEPSNFHPVAGDRVTASLRVGQKLNGDPLPRIPTLIDRFVIRGESGVDVPVIGRVGSDPAGIALIGDGGLHWIVYQSNPYPVALEAAKFEDYLKDEGLESIIEQRKKTGQSAAPGRERFYRCAKALLDTPSTAANHPAVFDAPLGLTLEIVPRANPYTLSAGGTLPLTVSLRGKPAANILVVAMNKNEPDTAVRVRTDARGRATVKLAKGGFWLVKAVFMEPAPADAGVDWQSWWASITFDLAGSHGT
jgi:uncharacterized GH25 family protein